MAVSAENKTDRRIKRTRHSLQQALLRLMNEKPFEKITVSELAAEADINRKTFYNHYHSVQDVRNDIDNEFIDMLISLSTEAYSENIPLARYLTDFITKFLNLIAKEKNSARLLFESGELYRLAEELKKLLYPVMLKAADENGLNTRAMLFYIDYIACGTLAVLRSWVCTGYDMPEKKVEDILLALILSNIPDDIGKRPFTNSLYKG